MAGPSRSSLSIAFGLGAIALAAIFSCAPETPLTTSSAPPARPKPLADPINGCVGNNTYPGREAGGSGEGEIYGSLYIDGLRRCTHGGDYQVHLVPDAATNVRILAAGLDAPFKNSLGLESDFHWMFEWWESGIGTAAHADGPCVLHYHEVSHADTTQPHEAHCLISGRYAFGVNDLPRFPVDYLHLSGHTLTNTYTAPGIVMGSEVEDTSYTEARSSYQDLIIQRDSITGTGSHSSDTPLMDIDAKNAPYSGSFTPFAASVLDSGTSATWFRVNAARSMSGWAGQGGETHGAALARVYWDGADTTQATGYYTFQSIQEWMLRIHRYPNPRTAFKDYVIGLEIMRPDELPANTPNVADTVRILRTNPDLKPANLSAPASAVKGTSLSPSFDEAKADTFTYAPVDTGWHGTVYLSTDAVLSPATDLVLGSFHESASIPKSASIHRSITGSIPANWPTGTSYVIVALDDSNAVAESSEVDNTVSRSIQITPVPPTACVSYEGTTTFKLSDQRFSAGCSTHGANVYYRWRTDAAGSWGPFSLVDTIHFAGHSSSGAHTVTLEVRDSSNRISDTLATIFTVRDSAVTLSGQIIISAKGTYTYSSNSATTVWSYQDSLGTGWHSMATGTPVSHLWPAECSHDALRADQSGSGVLRRKTVVLEVGTVAGCPLGGN